MSKVITALVLIVLVAAALVAGNALYSHIDTEGITSFEQCAAAGYPVGESYPRQCWTPSGEHFVEVIDEPVAESWGSIHGTVLLGPTCPVVRDPPDPACADKPYQARFVLTTADGTQVIKEFNSKSDGTFAVDAPAGEYTIRLAAGASMFPHCSSGVVQVSINETTTAHVTCDTGIR